MGYEDNDIDEYIAQLPNDRKEAMARLREIIKGSLTEGFEEVMQYGMITYAVPHSIYPSGYHVNPKDPLPFLSIASQKNHIAFYHLGIYMFPEILKWVQEQYPKYVKTKLDIGKACIRFKNTKTIPFDLIEELCRKITVKDFIEGYEKSLSKAKSK